MRGEALFWTLLAGGFVLGFTLGFLAGVFAT